MSLGNTNTRKTLSYLKQIQSFAEISSLRIITTDVISNEGAYVDVSFSFGKDVFNCSLKRRDKVKTFPQKTSEKRRSKDDALFDSYLMSDVLMATERLQPDGMTPKIGAWGK